MRFLKNGRRVTLIDRLPQSQPPPTCHVARAEGVFSRIAPIYDLFLGRPLTSLYRNAVEQMLSAIPTLCPTSQKPTCVTALDVGTGTGLMAAVLAERGFIVNAIDTCENMLKAARRRRPNVAQFSCAPAHSSSMHPEAPFDLVCAAMLMHGLPRAYRRQSLIDMARAAKHAVMIVDYAPPCRLLTAAIERLEGSFYQDFLHEFPEDLSGCFADVSTFLLNRTCALYLGRFA